eukprot:TRINITY_DN34_c0_g1_i2.p1 TRINITY_DN34_c0_g1~~TRINITY_DN34_c0_g1_i2.p1  ORF type:complete len:163 (-),score=62.96 TRINITY_DN34_c0_g1_i2:410-841(-)
MGNNGNMTLFAFLLMALWKFEWCFAASVSMDCDTDNNYVTSWDAEWVFFENSASFPEFLSGVGSVHSNYYEDRQFKFKSCTPSSSTDQLIASMTDLPSSDISTSWDDAWTHQCGSNEAIFYIRSRHDNDYEDRIWHFSVCLVT